MYKDNMESKRGLNDYMAQEIDIFIYRTREAYKAGIMDCYNSIYEMRIMRSKCVMMRMMYFRRDTKRNIILVDDYAF